MTYWCIACPSLRPELASVDRLLAGNQESEYIEDIPHEDWERFWASMEVLRVVVSDVNNWRNTFTQKSSGVLTTAERMAIPIEKNV